MKVYTTDKIRNVAVLGHGGVYNLLTSPMQMAHYEYLIQLDTPI